MRDLYFKVNPNYEGRFTVPVLWDKKLGTIGKFVHQQHGYTAELALRISSIQ